MAHKLLAVKREGFAGFQDHAVPLTFYGLWGGQDKLITMRDSVQVWDNHNLITWHTAHFTRLLAASLDSRSGRASLVKHRGVFATLALKGSLRRFDVALNSD